MSKLRDLEQKLERTEQQLQLFQQVSRLMTRDMSLEEALHEIVDLLCEFMECDSCLVYLVENDELVLHATNAPDRKNLSSVRLKLDEGLTGWVARERRLLAISREAYNDPRFKFFSDLPEDTYEAFLSAPVISQNKVVGVINIQHQHAHVHTGSEIELLSTIGEQVGCLMVLSRLSAEPELAADLPV